MILFYPLENTDKEWYLGKFISDKNSSPLVFDQQEMESIQEFQEWLKENEVDVPESYDYREMYR